MPKRLKNVEFNKIRDIILLDDDVINMTIDDEYNLIISSNIKPSIIDSNFTELDTRLKELEMIIKTKFNFKRNE